MVVRHHSGDFAYVASGACGDNLTISPVGRGAGAHPDSWGPTTAPGCAVAYGKQPNGASDIKRYEQIVLLGHICPTGKTRLPYSCLPSSTHEAPETEEAGGNLFRSRSRLGPLRLAADSPRLSAGGVTKPTRPTDLTALLPGCYYLSPCDNAPL